MNHLKTFLKNGKKGPKQNTANFISILSIPDLNLLFIFTTIKNNGGFTEYNFI
jgi:hypothetical protein